VSRTRLELWSALAIVYVVWGSTYLGIRVAVETIPPFVLAASRFIPLSDGSALQISLNTLYNRLNEYKGH